MLGLFMAACAHPAAHTQSCCDCAPGRDVSLGPLHAKMGAEVFGEPPGHLQQHSSQAHALWVELTAFV